MTNQPAIESHLQQGRAVFVCALSADCDQLTKFGCVATVANGEWPDIFAGRKVVVVGTSELQDVLDGLGAVSVLMSSLDIAAAESKEFLGAMVGRAFEVRAAALEQAKREDAAIKASPGVPPEELCKPETAQPKIRRAARAKKAAAVTHNLPSDSAAPAGAHAAAPDVTQDPEPDQHYEVFHEPEPSTAVKQSFGSLASRWAAMGLSCASNGTPHANASNALHVLQQDPSLLGQVWYDTFLQRLQTNAAEPREWLDEDDIALMIYMQRDLAIHKMSALTVRQAVNYVATHDKRNCLKDLLDSLPPWDKIGRCDAFFVDFFGADPGVYASAVGGNFWKSLVARALRPGCKFDNMVILEGEQGIRKSSACLAIVGAGFFMEAHENVMSKDFYISMQGKWLVEVNEMDSFSRAETTKVKSVISCTNDRYRAPYERAARDHPRQNVFIGTTNRDDYNKDETGFRRGWPIRCTAIDVDLIKQNRTQLFAEAIARLKAGEKWWLMPGEETRREQEARYAEDPWAEPVAHYLNGTRETTAADVLTNALGIAVGKQDKLQLGRAVAVMRTLGWRKANRARRHGEIVNLWRPASWFASQNPTPVPNSVPAGLVQPAA